MAVPFNNDYFWRYAFDGGNEKIDATNVRQMTIAVGGADDNAVGTPLYIDFAKVGNYTDGLDVPLNVGKETKNTLKCCRYR